MKSKSSQVKICRTYNQFETDHFLFAPDLKALVKNTTAQPSVPRASSVRRQEVEEGEAVTAPGHLKRSRGVG